MRLLTEQKKVSRKYFERMLCLMVKNKEITYFISCFFVFCIAFACLLCGTGCDDDNNGSSGGNSNETVTELHRQISSLEKQNADLNSRNNVLSNENRDLKEENQKAKEEQHKAEEERDKIKVILWITVTCISLLIAIPLGYVVVILSGKSKQTISTTDNTELTHCPRCGWEKTPGEKTCKNCKTHF